MQLSIGDHEHEDLLAVVADAIPRRTDRRTIREVGVILTSIAEALPGRDDHAQHLMETATALRRA